MDRIGTDMSPRKMAEEDELEAKKKHREEVKQNIIFILFILTVAAFFACGAGNRIGDLITHYVFR